MNKPGEKSRAAADGNVSARRIQDIVPGFDTSMPFTLKDGVYAGHKASEGIPMQLDADRKPFVYVRELVDWLEGDQGLRDWLSPLNGQVLVDIGAGGTAYGLRFAQMVGASAYVAIEGHYPSALRQSIYESMADEGQGRIPAVVIGEDMISALGRFPHDSVSVMASRIEPLCFRNGGSYKDMERAEDYVRAVEQQIRRILHPEGIFLSYRSQVYPTEYYEAYGNTGYALFKFFKHANQGKHIFRGESTVSQRQFLRHDLL